MRKFTSVVGVLTVVLLVLGSTLGAKSTDHMSVKKIVFTNGVTYDGKGVPSSYQPVMEAIRGAAGPKATFSVREGTLLVGLGGPNKGAKEVLSITWQSDCPVNSQFRFQQSDSAIAMVVRPTLVAWTKVRHPDLKKSKVKTYSQEEGRAEVVLQK